MESSPTQSKPIKIPDIKHKIKSIPEEMDVFTDSDEDLSLLTTSMGKMPRVSSADSLCFSVYIDSKKDTYGATGCTPPEKDYVMMKMNDIYPKETKKWVESSLVFNCQRCSIGFGMLTRQHHCRSCGGVFCASCCYQNIEIPEEYIHKPKEDTGYKQQLSNTVNWLINGQINKVCKKCFIKITNLKKITQLIKICEYLDLESLHNILILAKNHHNEKIEHICKSWQCGDCWHNAGIHRLSKFREIQYIDPDKKYNVWEMNFLTNERHKILLTGHNNWSMSLIKSTLQYYYTENKLLSKNDLIIKLILSTKYDQSMKYTSLSKHKLITDAELHAQNESKNAINEIKKSETIETLIHIMSENKKKSCWGLMCSRKCNIPLDILDFVEIMKFILVLETETKTNYIWNKLEIQKLILFLLKLMYSNTEVHETIIKNIIPLICSVFSSLMNTDSKKINHDFLIEIFNEISKFKNVLIYFVNEIDYISKQEFRSLGIINFSLFMKDYIKRALDYDYTNDINLMSKTLSDLNINEKKTDIKLPILYPLDYTYNIIKIIKASRLKSATLPLGKAFV